MSEIQRPRDVQVLPIGKDTSILRSRTWDRLKFEVEYALGKGTTANSYLIQGDQTALIDPPGESFTQTFLNSLKTQIDPSKLDYVILGHVNSNRIITLKALLELSPQLTFIATNPGALALRAALGDHLNITIVRGEDTLNLGQNHILQFIAIPTPRWPDGLCTYDPESQILYTDKLFGAHLCGDQVFDEGWTQLTEDRRYYYDCLHAAQAKQVLTALDKLVGFPMQFYAPGHGPLVRYGIRDLTKSYRKWSQQQKSQDLSVALIYASAYGNTTTLAQAIAKGLTKSGVAVDLINCELADPAEITEAVEKCVGLMIGTPTLAGHAPTQIQTALGIVLANGSKNKLAGVFGSYGWSGEAIDGVEAKLQDAGYQFGFETIRVKFKPTDSDLQQAEEAGVDFAQALKKTQKIRVPQASMTAAQADRTEQAAGRIVGSLCVLSAKRGEVRSGMLASWVSQATFNPPGLTIAVSKERAVEPLLHTGDRFVLNILAEGRQVRRHFMKNFEPGEDRFAGLETQDAKNGCPILLDALAYLECTVRDRMECGDHWVIYAVADDGKVLKMEGVTAMHYRKTASRY